MLEELKQFLNSLEWQEYIESFITTNCNKFKEFQSEEYSHEQYSIWKNFQEIAEQILEGALSELSGTEFGEGFNKLEKELDRISLLPSKGPRDAQMKELLGQLLTFDSFEAFAMMMSQAANNLELEENEEESYNSDYKTNYDDNPYIERRHKHREDNNKTKNNINQSPNRNQTNTTDELKYYSDLIAMGFSEELVRPVLENCSNKPLHELVTILSDMQEGYEENNSSSNNNNSSSNNRDYIDNEINIEDNDEFEDHFFSEDVNFELAGTEVGAGSGPSEEHLELFCKNEDLDYHELSTKRALAYSISDAVRNGSLVRANLELYKWACGMVAFDQELQSCYLFHRLSRTSPSSIKFNEWIVSGRQGRGANLREAYYQLENDRKESNERGDFGSLCSEKELMRMAELKRIAAMGTSDEQLMHTLIARHEEIANDLENHYRSCELLCSSNGIDTGIERIQLEEMYLFLKENVMSGEPIEVVSEKVYSYMQQMEGSKNNISAVNVLLDMHLLEDEQIMIKTRINALLRDPSSPTKSGSSFSSPSKKNYDILSEIETEVIPRNTSIPYKSDAKSTYNNNNNINNNNNNNLRNGIKEAFTQEKGILRDIDIEEKRISEQTKNLNNNNNNNNNNNHNSSLVHQMKEKLKEQHRAGLAKLKYALQTSRALQIGELQTKVQKLKEKTTLSMEERDLLQQEQLALENLLSILDQQEKGIISGFKQRCIAETKLIKNKVIDGIDEDDWNLNDTEKNLAAKSAAKNLRDKFEAESAKLREEQEYTRDKRKAALMEKLSRRKKGQSGQEVDEFDDHFEIDDEGIEKEAERLLKLEDEKEYRVLLRPLLTSMIASDIFDPSNLSTILLQEQEEEQESKESKNSNNEKSKNMKILSKWIQETADTSSNFTMLTDQLVDKLIKQTEGKESNQLISKTIGDLMTRVCLNQMDQNQLNTSNSNLNDHYDRIKQNLLDEYKKMKSNLDTNLQNKKISNQQNLKDRLSKREKNDKNNKEIGNENENENEVLNLSEITSAINSVNQSNYNKNKVYNSDISTVSSAERWANDRNNYLQKSSEILSQHQKHQSELMNTLEDQMNDRKKKLQSRLKVLQDSKEKKDETIIQHDLEEINRLKLLQKRYDDFMIVLKTSNPQDLEKIGLNNLLKQMDNIPAPPNQGSSSMRVPSHVLDTYLHNRPVEHKADSSRDLLNLQEVDVDYNVDSDAIRFAAKAAADLKRERYNEYKESIEEEAKKITLVYHEIQQKHDIAMKLEQARQSQNLQRKLLQRKMTDK